MANEVRAWVSELMSKRHEPGSIHETLLSLDYSLAPESNDTHTVYRNLRLGTQYSFNHEDLHQGHNRDSMYQRVTFWRNGGVLEAKLNDEQQLRDHIAKLHQGVTQ